MRGGGIKTRFDEIAINRDFYQSKIWQDIQYSEIFTKAKLDVFLEFKEKWDFFNNAFGEKDCNMQWMLVVVYWAVRGEMRALMEERATGEKGEIGSLQKKTSMA